MPYINIIYWLYIFKQPQNTRNRFIFIWLRFSNTIQVMKMRTMNIAAWTQSSSTYHIPTTYPHHLKGMRNVGGMKNVVRVCDVRNMRLFKLLLRFLWVLISYTCNILRKAFSNAIINITIEATSRLCHISTLLTLRLNSRLNDRVYWRLQTVKIVTKFIQK